MSSTIIALVILAGCCGMLATLVAPLNSTSVTALVTCAVSMSAAIFLILEMNHPLDGIIQVSSAPLEAALAVISK